MNISWMGRGGGHAPLEIKKKIKCHKIEFGGNFSQELDVTRCYKLISFICFI